MFTHTRSFQDKMPAYPFNTKVMMLQPIEVSDNTGSIRRSSEFKPFDIMESLLPFRSVDFEISSLQAVGALSKLKSTYMCQTSSMNIADSFDNFKFTENVQES